MQINSSVILNVDLSALTSATTSEIDCAGASQVVLRWSATNGASLASHVVKVSPDGINFSKLTQAGLSQAGDNIIGQTLDDTAEESGDIITNPVGKSRIIYNPTGGPLPWQSMRVTVAASDAHVEALMCTATVFIL
jgi:hypothetical protein